MNADEALKEILGRSILYTDTIHGHQTCVDNLWAATTEEIDAIEAELPTEAERRFMEAARRWMRADGGADEDAAYAALKEAYLAEREASR